MGSKEICTDGPAPLGLPACFLAAALLLFAPSGPAQAQSVEPSGHWTNADPNNSLKNPHVLGAATLLKNGRVLAAGGLSRDPKSPATLFSASTTAELFDPATNSWKTTGPLKTPRWSLDAITLDNGKALFAGGSSAFAPTAALQSAELFDPESGMFDFTGNELSAARHSFGISRLNDGRILISGGNPRGNDLGGSGIVAVDIYDPRKNRFEPAAALHQGRSLHAQVTLSDGRVVVIGGAQQDAEIYDPSKNAWTASTGRLPTTLKDMKAFELFNGLIFIAGGQNTVDGVTTDATWMFDPKTTEFTPGPTMSGFNSAPQGKQIGSSDYSAFDLFPAAHASHGLYLLFAGGEHDPLEGPDVELHSASIFDAQHSKFIDMGPMPFIHDDHTESLLPVNAAGNPEVLLFGGNRSKGTSRFEFQLPKP